MTLKEMKTKVLSMIEELSPENVLLTDDPDISAKINSVINQIMFELCRFKKLPKYMEIEVKEGDLLDFAALEKECGYEIYQLKIVGNVKHVLHGDGTVIKFLGSGTAEIDVFVYPESITEKTKDTYEFELTPDVLEVMPYGIAADLLKSDVSTNFGREYAERYHDMVSRLDSRNNMGSVFIDGGISI